MARRDQEPKTVYPYKGLYSRQGLPTGLTEHFPLGIPSGYCMECENAQWEDQWPVPRPGSTVTLGAITNVIDIYPFISAGRYIITKSNGNVYDTGVSTGTPIVTFTAGNHISV